MTARSKMGLIALLGVIALGVLLVLRQSPNQSAPLAATSTAPATSTSATPQSIPTATPAPTIASSMTTDEQRVMDIVLSSSPQFTTPSGDCNKILQSQPWCSVVQSVQQITRPEWTALFPQAKFFLVKRNVVGQETGFQQNLLVIEQADQRYSADTFGHLLSANNIVITDSNRELVAQAFVLTTMADYIEKDIVFSDWGTSDRPSTLRLHYNYTLAAWTKIQGLKIRWFFLFFDGSFVAAERFVEEQNVGDYTPVPFKIVPESGSGGIQSYYFQ